MNQRLMIMLEEEKNGRKYYSLIPMENQPYAEAHEVSLEFSKSIVEAERLARETAEKANKPAEVVSAEVVEKS